jgi:hypothetical protein
MEQANSPGYLLVGLRSQSFEGFKVVQLRSKKYIYIN